MHHYSRKSNYKIAYVQLKKITNTYNMKRLILISSLKSLLIMTQSCSKQKSNPKSISAANVWNAAVTVPDNDNTANYTYESFPYNPCTGEVVHLYITVNYHTHFTFFPNTGQFQYNEHFTQIIKGVGVTSGIQYTGTDSYAIVGKIQQGQDE